MIFYAERRDELPPIMPLILPPLYAEMPKMMMPR